MSQTFGVLSVQSGNVEGVAYQSAWVFPVEGDYEDRGAPHLTRGPVPMKIDIDSSAIATILQEAPKLPAFFDLEMPIRVGAGNKSKAFIKSAKLSAINAVDKETGEMKPGVEVKHEKQDKIMNFGKG